MLCRVSVLECYNNTASTTMQRCSEDTPLERLCQPLCERKKGLELRAGADSYSFQLLKAGTDNPEAATKKFSFH